MVRAIDIHVHPPGALAAIEPAAPPSAGTSTTEQYIGPRAAGRRMAVEDLAEYYASMDMMAVLLPMDAETVTGRPPMTNRYVAELVERYPDRFIGFGSVDPWKGRIAIDQLDEVVELGLKGLKFHAGSQRFFANDRRFYPLWERAQELALIVLFHSGTTAAGASLPGGGGIKLEFTKPIPFIDDVAADFPELRIIMAHPPFPWDREGLAMLMHKSNVFMDLSGWAPKYFDPLLVQYARTIAQDKMLYGSDWPVISPERWEADFAEYQFAGDVLTKIMRDNAARLLGLEELIGS